MKRTIASLAGTILIAGCTSMTQQAATVIDNGSKFYGLDSPGTIQMAGYSPNYNTPASSHAESRALEDIAAQERAATRIPVVKLAPVSTISVSELSAPTAPIAPTYAEHDPMPQPPTPAMVEPKLQFNAAKVPQTISNTENTEKSITNLDPGLKVHIMQRGDTLYSIARKNDLDVNTLMAWNNITDPSTVALGTELSLTESPTLTEQAPQRIAPQQAVQNTLPVPTQSPAHKTKISAQPQHAAVTTPPTSEVTYPEGFIWPINGKVVSGFGTKAGGLRNDGINIAADPGSPVRAAENGEVIYAGNELKGYGNLLIVQHDNGYLTAYAHNSMLNVKRGDKIRKGQVIAEVGQSGQRTFSTAALQRTQRQNPRKSHRTAAFLPRNHRGCRQLISQEQCYNRDLLKILPVSYTHPKNNI